MCDGIPATHDHAEVTICLSHRPPDTQAIRSWLDSALNDWPRAALITLCHEGSIFAGSNRPGVY